MEGSWKWFYETFWNVLISLGPTFVLHTWHVLLTWGWASTASPFLLCLSSWADSFKRPNSSVGLSSASCTPASERHRWARVSYHKKVGKSEWKRWYLSDHTWYQRKNSSASWLSILQVFPMFSPWFRLGTAPTDGSFGRNQGVPMPSLFTPGQFHLMLCLTAGHLILNEQHWTIIWYYH